MNHRERAQAILDAMGGPQNISYACHCATRLRLTAVDDSKVDLETIEKIPGVLGTVYNNNEYHIVIGTSVPELYTEFTGLGTFATGDAVDDPAAAAADLDTSSKKTTNWFMKITDFIAGSVLPALPIIVAGGMVSAVLVVCTNFLGVSPEGGTYIVLNSIYDAAFFFLPIFVGYSAAAKLKCSPMLGALLGAILVSGPINGVEGLDFMGVPITAVGYNGGIIPVLLGVAFMSLIYRPVERAIPEAIKFFLVPLITMVITVPVTLIALGPLGSWVGLLIGDFFAWLNATLGWFSVGIFAAVFPLMLYTGTAYGLYPIMLTAFAVNNCEAFVQPGGLAANLAVGGAALAVSTMLKNKEEKGMAFSTGLTAVFGITEPAIFGVLGRYRRPFIGVAIGAAIGGIFAGLTHVVEYTFASPGVAGILAFLNPDGSVGNLLFAIATMAIGFVGSFIATRLIGLTPEQEVQTDAEFEEEFEEE